MGNLSKGFNNDILAAALQEELDKVQRKFAEMPGRFLLRCVEAQRRFEGGGGEGVEVSYKEKQFLEDNYIAEVKSASYRDYGGGSDTYYTIKKFSPPWDRVMSDLAAQLRAGGRPRAPGLD